MMSSWIGDVYKRLDQKWGLCAGLFLATEQKPGSAGVAPAKGKADGGVGGSDVIQIILINCDFIVDNAYIFN